MVRLYFILINLLICNLHNIMVIKLLYFSITCNNVINLPLHLIDMYYLSVIIKAQPFFSEMAH
jgi:hypothetical protein